MLIWTKKGITMDRNLLSQIKMGKEILTFGDIENQKKVLFTAIRPWFFEGT